MGMSGMLPGLVARAADDSPRRHCILLWMGGGPSQTDTFDMKTGHENGGEFKEIATNAPGVRFSEHLPRLATMADKLAIVRSLSTKEGDHARATHMMRTGHAANQAIHNPAVGAALAKELAQKADKLPNYVSIVPQRRCNTDTHGAGYLGPRHDPLVVNATAAATDGMGNVNLKIKSVSPPADVGAKRTERRLRLWRALQERFLEEHPSASPLAHQVVYQNAVQLMKSDAAKAFDLSRETDQVRDKYGRGRFGQGCLMARRLIESGVSVVEVTLSRSKITGRGWDTHADNFSTVAELSAEMDAGWASLMEDLQSRGLLESTTILWLGEFGRTPRINRNAGRDHFPAAWTCVFAGGGIAGGQVYGKTSADGMHVEEAKVGVADILATLCTAVGVAPSHKNVSNTNRPIPIVDGKPIAQLLT